MQQIPSGLAALTSGALRHPTFKVEFSWGNHLSSGGWFRLDSSSLDSGDRLTFRPYLEGETIQEIITEIDRLIYFDESEYAITLEGFEEIIGDNDQYSISETDVKLDNTNGRFWPSYNKNRIKNPGFEDIKEQWNGFMGTGSDWTAQTDIIVSPYFAMYTTTAGQLAQYYTNALSVYSGQVATASALWTFSYYTRGSGEVTPFIYAFGAAHDTLTGNLTTDVLMSVSGSNVVLTSGEWTRGSFGVYLPSGTKYARCGFNMLTVSGSYFYNDNNQLEYGPLTDYEPTFIGDEILPRRAVRIQVGFDDINVPKFVGYTDTLKPTIRESVINIHSLDMGKRLEDIKVVSAMFSGQRTDQIVEYLAGQGGLDSTMWALESGQVTIPFVWYQEGSLWFYMKNAAEAENGRVFFDEEGILRFWNRDHFVDKQVVYEFDFDESELNIDFSIDNQHIKNKITVKANPREIQPEAVIFSETGYIEVEGSSTLTYWPTFNDPVTSTVQPVPLVDYTANTASDGSGSNITADVDITTYDEFAQSVKIIFTNSNAAKAYILGFQVRGTAATVVREINVIAEDAESELLYGVQPFDIENDWIQSKDDAQTLADRKLAEYKDPKDFVQMQVMGVPYLQVGDKVRLQNYYDGTTKELTIVRNRWQMIDDFVQNLELENRIT